MGGFPLTARAAAVLSSLGICLLTAACDQPQPPPQPPLQSEILRSTNGMRDFGDYVVYVNALTTNQLRPEVASEYGIVRSPSRAMLTVSVHRKQGDALPVAVASDIDSSAVNLTGQLKNVLLREIRESEAIYYVGELEIADQETLTYTLDITPEGEDEPLTVQFQKQFFVDR